MDAALRARIEAELPRGRWSPENHAKLVDFLATYSREAQRRPVDRPFALFDADNTTWTGDIGDASFVFMLRNLKLSPRLHELLPASIDVPAEGFGVTAPGRLFPRARVQAALDAMTGALRRACDVGASMSEVLRGFSEDHVLPGGPLHGDTTFANAYRIYLGTILGLYNLLDTNVGSVAFDFADSRVASSLYTDVVRDFYGSGVEALAPFGQPGKDGRCDVLFPAILDTGARQQALREQGRLGAYTQVAAWVGLDKTPDEVRKLAIRIWDGSPPLGTPFDAILPIDVATATSPAPIDFSADPSLFVSGGRPAEGVVLGESSMPHGTRIRPEIADLMAAMDRHGVVPVVVSASHVDLVHSVLERRYGFGSHPLTGMLPVLEGGAYGDDITAPAPYRPGKVDAARAIARRVAGDEDARPVFCAGDTNTDFEMMGYSAGYRLFFDRGMRPLMDLAEYLAGHGAAATTLIQAPFTEGDANEPSPQGASSGL